MKFVGEVSAGMQLVRDRWIIVLGSAVSVVALWLCSFPLGVPGEWVWIRTAIEPDLAWNLLGGAVTAALYIAYVQLVRGRLEQPSSPRQLRILLTAALGGLVAFGFAWLWVVQEMSPTQNRLGKAAFVLYYPSSSGYFTRARYEQPDAIRLLQEYEDLMRQGDVLHTGTHPPGLFLIFHGLIASCENVPGLAEFLDATQPWSFRESCDVIASNALRAAKPVVVGPLDRRVLWLATLLVMMSAALVVVPLFLLLNRTCPLPIAWLGAALWPAIPAVAIFIPKSDVLFPLIGTVTLWLWLTAWDRRSLTISFLSGVVAWSGLLCSLAFLPVFLAAAMLTLGSSILQIMILRNKSKAEASCDIPYPIDMRRISCILAAGAAFLIPTITLWLIGRVNLFNVWFLNYRNHAGFYQQFARSYWKWLLINPVELAFDAGWPVTFLALLTCIQFVTAARRWTWSHWNFNQISTVCSILSVWGMLWLTGKNSGEAARLWIIFLPWLIWLAAIEMDRFQNQTSNDGARSRSMLFVLILQFIVGLLTAVRINGFHLDGG